METSFFNLLLLIIVILVFIIIQIIVLMCSTVYKTKRKKFSEDMNLKCFVCSLLIVTVGLALTTQQYGRQEVININEDVNERFPILTLHNEDKRLLPNRSGEIVLPIGSKVCLYCTTDAFRTPFDNLKMIEAEFIGNKEFLIDGERHKLTELECNSIPKPTTAYNGEIIECAYDLGERRSEPIMRIYFNREAKVTLCVEYEIQPCAINGRKNVGRKNFLADPRYFGKNNLNNSLKQCKIKKEICETLRKNEEEIKPIWNEKHFLTRGHLAPKADFPFSGEQRATFDYLNVCLQWQMVNSGNCSSIEESIREYAYNNNCVLTCYAGCMDVCTLPDKEGVKRHINITYNKDRKIPVPKLIYRIVIAKETGEGIVFLCVNNPHINNCDLTEYIIGNDIADEVNWIKWDRRNIEKGFAYALTVPDFLATAQDFPVKELHTTGLLRAQLKDKYNFSKLPSMEEEMENKPYIANIKLMSKL